MEEIKFYSTSGEYGGFSNFSRHPILLDGKRWPTSEHYFQAKKFPGTSHEDEIRRAPSPSVAARLGRSRKKPLRKDWESVKVEVMHRALTAKFTQHESLRQLLLSTGSAKIIEHTKNDRIWADGGDGSGRNLLGKLLMRIREELKP